MVEDLFSKIYKNKGPLGKWASQAEGYFVFPKLEGPISNKMKFNGKEVITWSVNDYLGLASHPEIRDIDAKAAKEYGSAYPMGARMMSGHTKLHEELETKLSDFVKKDSSYVLNFGYQGILSTVDSLVSKDDVIVCRFRASRVHLLLTRPLVVHRIEPELVRSRRSTVIIHRHSVRRILKTRRRLVVHERFVPRQRALAARAHRARRPVSRRRHRSLIRDHPLQLSPQRRSNAYHHLYVRRAPRRPSRGRSRVHRDAAVVRIRCAPSRIIDERLPRRPRRLSRVAASDLKSGTDDD